MIVGKAADHLRRNKGTYKKVAGTAVVVGVVGAGMYYGVPPEVTKAALEQLAAIIGW